ncbi:bifunctional 2-polyprenyl-6-hydroxyphenol methylase/3-demethylubiquinol 3-O-methyltransferase UbiG [Isoptericola variabilis]|nr:class I SAM-dependent methyltransferase [Isoptericola variabilis]
MPAPPARVLEIGCGQGAVGVRLAAAGYDWTGVELDGTSAQVARQRLEHAGVPGQVVHGSVEGLMGADGFDVVCAFEVLEHIEDDRAALAAWVDRLRPGGLLLISTPAWQDRYGPMDRAVGHFRRYDPPSLGALLGDAGLVDVGQRLYGMPLGYVLEVVRNQIARHRLESDGASVTDRTARSGRLFQPSTPLAGLVTRAGTWPFRKLQRAFPRTGTGLVVWGRRPAAEL